ncbi:MAG TPA: hypothetical protein VNM48_19705, partial [Chloroflexota bacterium]|nr:hypothetical protein [Chloroflexota bacterium]
MIDVPQKTRHAVRMACAARTLARAAGNDHLKRLVGRYCFVHLHDVVRYAPRWKNQLGRSPATQVAVEAAAPALARLRRDWDEYQEVRHFLAAKRKPRDPDAAVDQLATFRAWARIGELSVETLVDDAIEVYSQLSAFEHLPAVEYELEAPAEVARAFEAFTPVGEQALLEVDASTFAAARPNTIALRMGEDVGRLIPLINDVAESAKLLAELASAVSGIDPLHTLVTCSLPMEIVELLRLSVGPPDSVLAHTPDTTSLLALYRSYSDPGPVVDVLEELRNSIDQPTWDWLLGWRNHLGAHTDDQLPWTDIATAIQNNNPARWSPMLDWITLRLEHAACTPGGPPLLLLGHRHLRSLLSGVEHAEGLPYDDVSTAVDPGGLPSALPPDHADSRFAIHVAGTDGARLVGAVA